MEFMTSKGIESVLILDQTKQGKQTLCHYVTKKVVGVGSVQGKNLLERAWKLVNMESVGEAESILLERRHFQKAMMADFTYWEKSINA